MKKYAIYITTALLLLLTQSCGEDFLDVNDDPYAVLDPNLEQMLTQTELNLGLLAGSDNIGVGEYLMTFVHQGIIRGDKYDIAGTAYMIEVGWGNVYTLSLLDLEVIIQEATQSNDMHYAGIAKILKAYTYSVLVDMYGDVPFSQACKIAEYPNPQWDQGENIYPALFDLLDEAIQNLQDNTAENTTPIGENDLFYNGDTDKWITLANSLKLKLYNQVRLVSGMYDATEVNALIAGDIIDEVGEDWECPFFAINSPEARNPDYTDEYGNPGAQYSISPWFYEVMKGDNPDIFNGIEDPRIPYYWFNQLAPGDDPDNTPEYRDEQFISIIFGSDGPNHNADVNNAETVLGFYPCGGRYDDGQGGTALTGQAEGTGDIPQRLLTKYDMLFIRAELAQAGLTTENARNLLSEAIDASFEKVQDYINSTSSSQSIPDIYNTQAHTDYRDAVLTQYDNASADKQMEIIMTQKWIAAFGTSLESYNDYRRTGYPTMYDPNTDVLVNGPAGHDGYTSCSRSYPFSLPWPSDELLTNPNAPAQKNPGVEASRVFWDIN